ncbi:MAG: ABC transporter ATP-binding protein [Haloferacaceae archaeon]
MTIFETRDLRKSFGGIDALDGATLSLNEGELAGLIGPNGAGKTTFFNCATGFIEPDGGTVTLEGEDVTANPPHDLAKRGLVRTFQLTQELETMTVRENVMLSALDHPGEEMGAAMLRPDSVGEREAEIEERADELLERFELDEMASEYAGSLSGGQGKLLELARTMMLEPDVLLLDEPFSGVNPTLVGELVPFIEEINASGTTVLIIEHEIGTLADLVDRLVVLHEGSVLVDGDPEDTLENEDVRRAYFGT